MTSAVSHEFNTAERETNHLSSRKQNILIKAASLVLVFPFNFFKLLYRNTFIFFSIDKYCLCTFWLVKDIGKSSVPSAPCSCTAGNKVDLCIVEKKCPFYERNVYSNQTY